MHVVGSIDWYLDAIAHEPWALLSVCFSAVSMPRASEVTAPQAISAGMRGLAIYAANCHVKARGVSTS